MEAAASSRWVRSLRSPRRRIDPQEPIGHLWEEERTPDGGLLPAFTIFLAGAECPFTCVFCDLWRETLDGPTPPGALPAQIRKALAAAGPLPRPAAVKLYNASNFFEPRAVPVEDEVAILDLAAPFARVTVECHPRLIGDRCLRFAERLAGRLEVAMGLETVHPEALPRLNKGLTLDDFDRAAATLRQAGIGMRAFVLVGAPFVPPEEAADWAVRSAVHAIEQGAERVSLIPVRGGNGAMEALRDAGDFTPPRLDQLEEALERSLDLGIVTADLWDVRRFASCPDCADARLARLDRMNRSGQPEIRVSCAACGEGRS
ncbi:MAG: radical SAM protein [Thermoanaerobaculia bacterium]